MSDPKPESAFTVKVPKAWTANPTVARWLPIVTLILGAVGGILGFEIVTGGEAAG